MIPAVDTERLTLRGPTRADLESSLAMWSDSDVVRYIGDKPFTREEVWARLLRYIGHWSLLGYGFWVVRERATGDYVGEVGIGEFMRDLPAPLESPEVGWVLAKSAHGKGYATEAVRGALGWASFQRFACLIHVDNAASIRVATKCGFRERARAAYHDEPTIIFGLDSRVA